jgi:hypothetical protein
MSNVDLSNTLGWGFAAHAREQCQIRGIGKLEVLECLALPEASVPARAGRRRYLRGDLEVIVSEPDQTIVTAYRNNYRVRVA